MLYRMAREFISKSYVSEAGGPLEASKPMSSITHGIGCGRWTDPINELRADETYRMVPVALYEMQN